MKQKVISLLSGPVNMYFDKELNVFPSGNNFLWEKKGYLYITLILPADSLKRTVSCSVFYLDISRIPCH